MPPTRRRQLCGVNNHYINGEPVYISDPKFIKLVQLANKEFRPNWPLCKKCADSLKPTLELKRRRYKELLRRRNPLDISSPTESSSTSSDSNGERINISSSSEETDERMVNVAAARDRARREFEMKRNAAMTAYARHLYGG